MDRSRPYPPSVCRQAGFHSTFGMDSSPARTMSSATEQAANRSRRGGAPIFVQLQRTGPAVTISIQAPGLACVYALAREAIVTHHAVQSPATCARLWPCGRGCRWMASVPCAGPVAAAKQVVTPEWGALSSMFAGAR